MIRYSWQRPEVKEASFSQPNGKKDWYVIHPSNGCILVYCDSQAEANDAADKLEALAKGVRPIGRRG